LHFGLLRVDLGFHAIDVAVQAAHLTHGARQLGLGTLQADFGIVGVKVDQHLAFLDQITVVGANADHGALGAPFDATGWRNSSVGDSFQSKVSLANDDLGLDGGAIGNPGFYASPAPEPETYAMMLAGLGLVFMAKRRHKES
jgi:hypothetical protein